MKRYACTFLTALVVVVGGCKPAGKPATIRGVPVTQDMDSFKFGQGDGYRGPIVKPTRAVLTVSRTGHEDKVVKHTFRSGDEAAFGYTTVTFQTRAGVEEHRFIATLRRIRRVGHGSQTTDDNTHAFFLDAPIRGTSGTMRNPLRFGEALEFRVLTCKGGVETIRLTILFEEIGGKPGGGD
jgi:hypothetical protein